MTPIKFSFLVPLRIRRPGCRRLFGRARLGNRQALARGQCEFASDEAFDPAQGRHLIGRDKGKSIPGRGSPSRTADAVDIVFGIGRYIIIDHMRDAENIDSPRRNIGGNQDLILPASKTLHRLKPLDLGAAGMNGYGRNSGVFQTPPDFVGPVFGARKDQDAGHLLFPEQVQQKIHLSFFRNRKDLLGNGFNRSLLVSDLDSFRGLHNAR